jgi:acyl carrier protein
MSTETGVVKYDREAVFRAMLGILESMTSDWEMGYAGSPRPETRLISDLGFESIDIVHLVVAIEEHFNRRDLPFEELLMADGRYVSELRVGEIVEFLVKHLNDPE